MNQGVDSLPVLRAGCNLPGLRGWRSPDRPGNAFSVQVLCKGDTPPAPTCTETRTQTRTQTCTEVESQLSQRVMSSPASGNHRSQPAGRCYRCTEMCGKDLDPEAKRGYKHRRE